MRGMLQQLDQKSSSQFQRMYDKFTIFEEYKKYLETIQQDASQTKYDLPKVVTDVEEIEKDLEFQCGARNCVCETRCPQPCAFS